MAKRIQVATDSFIIKYKLIVTESNGITGTNGTWYGREREKETLVNVDTRKYQRRKSKTARAKSEQKVN